MSNSVICRTQRKSLFLLHFFGVFSRLLHVVRDCSGSRSVLVCYGMFQFVSFLQTATNCKLILLQSGGSFIIKWGIFNYIVAQVLSKSFFVLQTEQVVLQSREAIIKWSRYKKLIITK